MAEAQSKKNRLIPCLKQIHGTPLHPALSDFGADKGGSETFGMTSEGMGEMFEGDFADMCADKFPLISMGGRADQDQGFLAALQDLE